MEWIKKILEKHIGEDGKLNMEAVLKEINKDAPDNVVPKYKYNDLSESKKQADADIKTRDKQLEDLKKTSGNAEDLQKEIETLQAENKRIKTENDEKIATMKYDTAIESALKNALHPDLISSKIDRTKLKINDDGSITGLDEQVKDLQKTYADQFKIEKKGKSPNNPEGGNGEITQEAFNKMKYPEKAKLYVENKELYTQLVGGKTNER